MEDARIPTSEQLMAEMGWVRKLARALVKDDALADDVAQDTWLVAAEQQPDVDRPLRPWLARVVTNLVRTRRRSDARREDRHATVGDDRAVPTPAELVERVELQRAVAEELLALAEPYRSTVLLHFIEGYSGADIARRLRIPDGTVRRRLKVAIDQLREALRKRTDQPERGWLAALVPLSRLPGPTPASASIGILAMKKVIGIVALVLLLLAIGGGVVWLRRARRQGVTTTSSANTPLGHGSGAADLRVSTLIPEWLAQAGVPARRIAGRVVFRGAPIGGARVQLGLEVTGESMSGFVMPDSMSKLLQPIAEVTSAADGTFDFGAQPATFFTVSASARDYAAVAVPVPNVDPRAKTDQLVLALGDCRSRLSGVVADASGGGIAKARISIAGLSGTESDAIGNYSVCMSPRHGLGTPTAQVRIEADGYGAIRQDVIVVGNLHLDFRLVPEAVLVGRVTTSDGQPVVGARVVAGGAPPSLTIASGWTTSDRDGMFRIGGLAPAAFELSAVARGLRMKAPVAVVATPAATSREIKLVLGSSGPSAQVRGQVLMNGAPVAGAVVGTAMGAGGSMSQADGSFVLDSVPYGTARFTVDRYRVEDGPELKIDRPVVDGVRLDVARLASIRGHVTRGGTPVAGADVIYMAAPQTTVHGPPPVARTDASGAFVIESVPTGPGRLNAWEMSSKAFSEWIPVDIGPADEKTIDLDLACAGEVKGTVVDQAGSAVPGVYVRMDLAGSDDMCEAMTDATGQFDCSMLYGGMYKPTVSPLPGGRQGLAPAKGDALELIRVPKDGVVTGVTLAVVHERVVIRGSVVDDTGIAIPDVFIEAIGRGNSSMDAPSTMSDADGRFEIGDLARGAYMLRARAADGSETEVRDVAAGSESITVTLSRAGAIEGTLVGFSKSPDMFALLNVPGGKLTRLLVDGARFSKLGLAPGRYTIEAQTGAEVDAQSVEVRPGETAKLTLRNRGAGTVEGTVTDFATHAPLAGLRCDAKLLTTGQTMMVPPDVAQQAFTDAAGHYAVSAPIGHVRIVCFAMNGEPRSPAGGDVDVTHAGPAEVNGSSVRASFGDSPGNAGFMVAPFASPVTVADVLPNGPAAGAGLRVGDTVATIDGASLQGLLPDGVMFLVANHRPGTVVTLGISRGGAMQTIRIPVGKPPM
jgi:RNA polymerase sigma-70 factor (ECF subfamily)